MSAATDAGATPPPAMLGDCAVVDTFAEAFPMYGARVIITGADRHWATVAATSMTGFATSVIGCKCEAAIERHLEPEETPDARPGVSVLLFAMDAEGVGKRLVERVGQSVMTCPTTSCFNGISPGRKQVDVGGQLRYFGDRFQASKVIDGRRFWRVPVMDGEFLVEEVFGAEKGVGGGNLIVLGRDAATTLRATRAAADAIRGVRDVIMPMPGGIVRSGSKVGSLAYAATATTNHRLAPTLRVQSPETSVPAEATSVLEIVLDGLTQDAVVAAMAAGTRAAAGHGALQVTAGNYGGSLGPFHLHLHEALGLRTEDERPAGTAEAGA